MPSRSKKHRGLWAIVLVLVVILLAVTCPSRDDHRQAVSAAFHEYVNHEMAADADDELDQAFGMLGSLLVNTLVDKLIDNVLSTQNYLVCSVGTITAADGEKERVSFGILGHVFTFNDDDIAELVNDTDD